MIEVMGGAGSDCGGVIVVAARTVASTLLATGCGLSSMLATVVSDACTDVTSAPTLQTSTGVVTRVCDGLLPIFWVV